MATREPVTESIIEPDLPIVDPHHHLWVLPAAEIEFINASMCSTDEDRIVGRMFTQYPRYLIDELVADVGSGHNVMATVAMEAHRMHRASGPEHLRSTGEIEFFAGVAAMSDSGLFGSAKLCLGIVGGVEMLQGDLVQETLAAHIHAAGGRYRGIRPKGLVYDENLVANKELYGTPRKMADPRFRAAFRHLEPLGLSCDFMLLDCQLSELLDLARAFPQTQMILNHTGAPTGFGPYRGKLSEKFPVWRKDIRALAACPNIAIKLGGLGMPSCGFPSTAKDPRAGSDELAKDWRPYIETCIEAFGVNRCMFESNFPIEAISVSYPVLWNAFKKTVSSASKDEKTALFSGTATQVYRLNV